MPLIIAPLLPNRRFRSWLLLGVALAFAFSIGGAAALGFQASAIENGPQEDLELLLLFAATLAFLTTAFLRRDPGAPVLMMLSLIFGLLLLREFEAPVDDITLNYLASHAARWHWAALTSVAILGLAVRDRRWTAQEHLRGSSLAWTPLIIATVAVGLGSLAEDVASAATDGTRLHDLFQWMEETLEVCGYAVACVTACWMLRIRPAA